MKNNTYFISNTPTKSIPSETVYKIASANLDKTNHPDVNIVIPTVTIQDPKYKQNNHQKIPSQIPSPLLNPKFPIATSNLQKSTDHLLDKNNDIANTNAVSDSQQTMQKNRPFLRKRSSHIPSQKLNNPTSTTLQKNKKNHHPIGYLYLYHL